MVLSIESGAPPAYTQQALSMAGDVLQNHRLVRNELGKLWKQLLPAERAAASLAAAQGPAALTPVQQEDLLARGLLVSDERGLRLFSALFAHYARRQGLASAKSHPACGVAIDAGRCGSPAGR